MKSLAYRVWNQGNKLDGSKCLSYKLLKVLLSEERRSLLPCVTPRQPGELGVEIVPVESDRGPQEEHDVEGEKNQDWEVEIQTES